VKLHFYYFSIGLVFGGSTYFSQYGAFSPSKQVAVIQPGTACTTTDALKPMLTFLTYPQAALADDGTNEAIIVGGYDNVNYNYIVYKYDAKTDNLAPITSATTYGCAFLHMS
jgi:hypothetical protein